MNAMSAWDSRATFGSIKGDLELPLRPDAGRKIGKLATEAQCHEATFASKAYAAAARPDILLAALKRMVSQGSINHRGATAECATSPRRGSWIAAVTVTS
jgi:hypothetical protein